MIQQPKLYVSIFISFLVIIQRHYRAIIFNVRTQRRLPERESQARSRIMPITLDRSSRIFAATCTVIDGQLESQSFSIIFKSTRYKMWLPQHHRKRVRKIWTKKCVKRKIVFKLSLRYKWHRRRGRRGGGEIG